MMIEYSAPIRFLVVEDEGPTRRAIRRLLESDPDVKVVGETSGADTPRMIRERAPDVVTLDVNMPGMNGLEALAELTPAERPLVIFVTGQEEHAPRAFDLEAVDYVLKPFDPSRLEKAVGRAKDRILRERREAVGRKLLGMSDARPDGRGRPVLRSDDSTGPEDSRIALRDGARILLLDQHQILWIEAEGSYSRVHTESGSELVRATLGSLEQQLDERRFFRIHRSAVVGLDHLREVSHDSHGDYVVRLKDGTKLRLARSRKEEFETRLGVT